MYVCKVQNNNISLIKTEAGHQLIINKLKIVHNFKISLTS